MSAKIVFPQNFKLEPLVRNHPRPNFDCGQHDVNAWLRTKALQHQDKRLSSTKVLMDASHEIAGFYTLATGQVDFAELPGNPYRLFLRSQALTAMMAPSSKI